MNQSRLSLLRHNYVQLIIRITYCIIYIHANTTAAPSAFIIQQAAPEPNCVTEYDALLCHYTPNFSFC